MLNFLTFHHPLLCLLGDLCYLLWIGVLYWKLRKMRKDYAATVAECGSLLGQNLGLKESLDGAHMNLMLIEQANYRMGCELYGKRQVDQAIRRAHENGVN